MLIKTTNRSTNECKQQNERDIVVLSPLKKDFYQEYFWHFRNKAR